MLQICLFEDYLKLLCMEELLSEVGVSRAAGQVQTSQCHSCLGFVSIFGFIGWARGKSYNIYKHNE